MGYFYFNADINEVEAPKSILADSTELSLTRLNWYIPVLSGAVYRNYSYDKTEELANQSYETNQPYVKISAGGEETSVQVLQDKNSLFNGSLEEFASFAFKQNGEYTVLVTSKYAIKQKPDRDGYGTAFTSFTLRVNVEPEIYVSAESIKQGGVIAVVVNNNLGGEMPTIKTELGLATFSNTPVRQTAFVPVAYNREVGKWPITVTLGETKKEFEITVIHEDFARQDMTIDQDIADSTINSDTARVEYRNIIWPLYEYATSEVYFSGKFIKPVGDVRVSTEYGLTRYVNGAFSERHSGIDFAAPLGTEVKVPAAGKVLFAGLLQLSGNTVVIEHGLGMKSFFFHMDSIAVQKGDSIQQGDIIGQVGSTGYSTGPHLHYEVKIGSQSINPWDLFNGSSGIFYDK